MTYNLAVAVLAILATFCVASTLREKRQANQQQYGSAFQCPNPSGTFSNSADCSTYFQCFEGKATLMNCVAGLEFNPERNYCDTPNNVPQNACTKTSSISAVHAICGQAQNRGEPGYTYYAAHSSFCNAFFSCGDGFLHGQCTFCGAGLIFNAETGKCESVIGLSQEDIQRRCGNRQLVPRDHQVFRLLEDSCNPTLVPNPYRPILEKLAQTGAYSPSSNQGGYVPQYNNNNGYPQQGGQQGGYPQQGGQQGGQGYPQQ